MSDGRSLGAQEMLAAEDIQRQVTVVLCSSRERNGPIDGRAVDHRWRPGPKRSPLAGSRSVTETHRQNQFSKSRCRATIFFVARANIRSDRRQLQPVERALAGQRFATITRIRPILACRIGLSHEHRQQRIGPELIVVVEILVPQRQSKHTLLEQGFDRVFDLLDRGDRRSRLPFWPSDRCPLRSLPKATRQHRT